MNMEEIDELEFQSREAIEKLLNHVQATTLLASHLEGQIFEIGQTLQEMSSMLEQFVSRQRNSNP